MENVEFADGAEETALCVMLGDIIKGNLEKSSQKKLFFNFLKGDIFIEIYDVEIELMMSFRRGKLIIYDWKARRPQITIRTDSSTLLDLSNLQVKCGIPYFFDEMGKATMQKFFQGQLKIKGGIFYLPKLIKLTNILSVADR